MQAFTIKIYFIILYLTANLSTVNTQMKPVQTTMVKIWMTAMVTSLRSGPMILLSHVTVCVIKSVMGIWLHVTMKM